MAERETEAFLAWEEQDQLLLFWLQSTLSMSILSFSPRVIRCSHSFELWEGIHKHFQSQTRVKSRQLCTGMHAMTNIVDEEVYIVHPSGFVDTNITLVFRLPKAIHGLKQASRAWFERLQTTLLYFGFQGSKCDSSLLIYKDMSCTAYLLVYVDDIILTGSDSVFIQVPVTKLHGIFALEKLSYFLGVEV